MTIAESLIFSATAELKEDVSKKKRAGLLEELRAMSRAMQAEGGLINHAQAALVLDVSTRRVGELVETGKVRRFEFLGRTYVSVREVLDRSAADIKNGRPPRKGLKKLVKTVEIVANYDAANFVVESFVEGGMATPKKKRKKELFTAVMGGA